MLFQIPTAEPDHNCPAEQNCPNFAGMRKSAKRKKEK
jgi:hypothetical protein